ncbi:unnamed protein product [Knipowitschia caucasica]|uniref:Uncharacterized protein n=1 Tax=Knipowitschia caucasica TaxID=637954 RepID=A0AAV2J1K2_KNICA
MFRLAGTVGAVVSVCVIWACGACGGLQSCGDVQCGAGQQCCPPAGPGNSTKSSVGCCKLPIHVFFDNVGWFTRKLSGILIMLLLFAMGYFIQRIICPRPSGQPSAPGSSEAPSQFYGHASQSQDSLLEQSYSMGDMASSSLPAYEEVKYLPTYEESMREEMHRERSDELLLCGSSERRRDVPEPGRLHSPRTCRNSV